MAGLVIFMLNFYFRNMQACTNEMVTDLDSSKNIARTVSGTLMTSLIFFYNGFVFMNLA